MSNGWGSDSGWSLKITRDRMAEVKVFSKVRHTTGRVEASRKALAQLEAVLAREDFFSLPPYLGYLPVDGPFAEIEVRDGSKQHKVLLGILPPDLAIVWKSDPSSIGRGYRVCEAIRLAFPGPDSQPCPGVPSASPK